jgi:hypothetical protein
MGDLKQPDIPKIGLHDVFVRHMAHAMDVTIEDAKAILKL